MSQFLSPSDLFVGHVLPGVGPLRPVGERPSTVAEDSALGHVLRRLGREAAQLGVTYLAEFESSLACESQMS